MNVIVSGGSRGLGLEICCHLAELGYKVYTFARNVDSELFENLASQNITIREIDATDSLSVKYLINSLDSIYAVINNSAIAVDGILATLPEVEIDRMIDINLTAPIKMTRYALRKMLKASQPGRIINISSITGSRGYNGLGVYSATKAGLDGFTRAMARELGNSGITVNSIAPGFMETQLSAGLNGDQLGQIIRRTPTGKLVTTEEVAELVQYLLSESARSITGQTITIDGGITA